MIPNGLDQTLNFSGRELLQILRTAAVSGNSIPEETREMLRQNRELLRAVPAEEAQSALTALLCGDYAAEVLRTCADSAAVLLPEIVPMFGFAQHNPHHDRDVWEHTLAVLAAAPPTPVMRWAALLHDIGKPACFSIQADGLGHFYGHAQKSAELAEQILDRLGVENRDRILRLIRYHDLPIPPERKPVLRLLRRFGEETVRQLIALHQADTMGQSALCAGRIAEYQQVEAVLDALLEEEARFSLRDLAINGRDLLALGFRGKAIGTALDRAFHAVQNGAVPNEREILLRWMDAQK